VCCSMGFMPEMKIYIQRYPRLFIDVTIFALVGCFRYLEVSVMILCLGVISLSLFVVFQLFPSKLRCHCYMLVHNYYHSCSGYRKLGELILLQLVREKNVFHVYPNNTTMLFSVQKYTAGTIFVYRRVRVIP